MAAQPPIKNENWAARTLEGYYRRWIAIDFEELIKRRIPDQAMKTAEECVKVLNTPNPDMPYLLEVLRINTDGPVAAPPREQLIAGTTSLSGSGNVHRARRPTVNPKREFTVPQKLFLLLWHYGVDDLHGLRRERGVEPHHLREAEDLARTLDESNPSRTTLIKIPKGEVHLLEPLVFPVSWSRDSAMSAAERPNETHKKTSNRPIYPLRNLDALLNMGTRVAERPQSVESSRRRH